MSVINHESGYPMQRISSVGLILKMVNTHMILTMQTPTATMIVGFVASPIPLNTLENISMTTHSRYDGAKYRIMIHVVSITAASVVNI